MLLRVKRLCSGLNNNDILPVLLKKRPEGRFDQFAGFTRLPLSVA